MRFLVDANLPRRLRAWLSTQGHLCDHVLDLGLAQASDEEIWRAACESGAAIVSKDQDFADRAQLPHAGAAVVWIRTGNGTTAELVALLARTLPTIEYRLELGDRLIEVRR